MADKVLSTATITINNNIIAIKDNDVTINNGASTFEVKAASIGGGKSVAYVAEDVSTQTGMVKFKIVSTENNKELFDSFQRNQHETPLTVTWHDRGVGGVMTGAVIVNPIEWTLSKDGEAEIELQGDQIRSA